MFLKIKLAMNLLAGVYLFIFTYIKKNQLLLVDIRITNKVLIMLRKGNVAKELVILKNSVIGN